MGVNDQLMMAELRQTRADVNHGPHKLIAHPTMRALWHDFFSSERVDCATFWAAFPDRLPMDAQRALRPVLQSEDIRDTLMAIILRQRSVLQLIQVIAALYLSCNSLNAAVATVVVSIAAGLQRLSWQ